MKKKKNQKQILFVCVCVWLRALRVGCVIQLCTRAIRRLNNGNNPFVV